MVFRELGYWGKGLWREIVENAFKLCNGKQNHGENIFCSVHTVMTGKTLVVVFAKKGNLKIKIMFT